MDEKKKLIDQTLEGIKSELAKVEKSVSEFDGKREKAFGEISTKLQVAAEQTSRLQDTTGKLQLALASTKVRGQWGERMAEDILQLAGFIRGINYEKQATQTGASRPDYTFPLPQGKKVNMDVKFPLDNYFSMGWHQKVICFTLHQLHRLLMKCSRNVNLALPHPEATQCYHAA